MKIVEKNVSDKNCILVLQIDFSEYYSILQQDEIQSTHWTDDHVSIYTTNANTCLGTFSYAIISNYMQHNKIALLHSIVNYLQIYKFVDIFSGGAAQHFK